MRIQKILSQAGLGSRREMEKWIAQGCITVNGKVAKLGDSITESDRIYVKGKLFENPLKHTQTTRILLYHKPVGEISSRHDPMHTKTVFDRLPTLTGGRWVQVGRLDINTSGLLIFTNDGSLANQWMHPRYAWEREYAVRVIGDVTPAMLKAMQDGVKLEDGPAQFKRIDYQGGEGQNRWYHVVICEGRQREVRRLWASQGVTVSRLMRIRFGHISLPRNLSRGEFVELSAKEVQQCLSQLNINTNKNTSKKTKSSGAASSHE